MKRMIVDYLYDDDEPMLGADRTYWDTPATKRAEIETMLRVIGAGDTVRVQRMGAFGNGQAVNRILRRIEATGAVVELVQPDKRAQGRPKRNEVTSHDKRVLCGLWYSAMEPGDVFEEAKERGYDMNRSQFDYMCGPRDGSKRDEKLKEPSNE